MKTLILHPFIEPKESGRYETIDISAVTMRYSHPMIFQHVTLLVVIKEVLKVNFTFAGFGTKKEFNTHRRITLTFERRGKSLFILN